VAKVHCWLNQAREIKRRGKQRRGVGQLMRQGEWILARRRRRPPASRAHLLIHQEQRDPAHLRRSARTCAALCSFIARAALAPLCLYLAPPLLVHGPVRPRLCASPLLVRRLRPRATPTRRQWPGNSISNLRSSFSLLCWSWVALLVLALL